MAPLPVSGNLGPGTDVVVVGTGVPWRVTGVLVGGPATVVVVDSGVMTKMVVGGAVGVGGAVVVGGTVVVGATVVVVVGAAVVVVEH